MKTAQHDYVNRHEECSKCFPHGQKVIEKCKDHPESKGGEIIKELQHLEMWGVENHKLRGVHIVDASGRLSNGPSIAIEPTNHRGENKENLMRPQLVEKFHEWDWYPVANYENDGVHYIVFEKME